jgi:FHS family Na+ dependent glucose MFS transporter 1
LDEEAAARKGTMQKTAGYFGTFVAHGMAVSLLGPTLSALAAHTGSPLSQISLMFTARSLGYLVGALAGGTLYDRLRGHPVLIGGLCLMGVGLILVPVLPVLWLLGLAMLLVGLAEGINEVGGNTLVLWVQREKAGPFANALHFFFGVGAFLGPVVVAQSVALTGDIQWAYWFCACTVVPVVFWLFRLPSPPRQAARARAGGRGADYGLVALVALFFLLYAGAEHSFGGWVASYSRAMQLASVAGASYLSSAFWGAITAGRLLGIAVTARVRPWIVVTADLLACLVSIGLILALPQSAVALWLGTLGLGLALASIVPTTLALVGRRMGVTGRTTGGFFVGLGTGAMTVPLLIGQLFDRVGPLAMPWTIAADLVLAVVVYILLLAHSGRMPKLPEAGGR